MNALEKLLYQRIEKEGAIRLDDWMEAALYHPEFGYYTTQNPFSDFITAPELTPLFGEAMAVWLVQQWQELGAPQAWQLLECGAGQGTLMLDVLSTLQKIAPECAAGCAPTLLEISPRLQKIQKETLAALSAYAPTWITDIQQAKTDVPTLLIGNEFLDAFPVRQFQKLDATWQERFVHFTAEASFHFVWQEAKNLPEILPDEEGIVEVSPEQIKWIQRLKHHFSDQKLSGILIDYAVSGGDTLQALKKHEFVPPLSTMGETDLTTHVNFSALIQATQLKNSEVLDLSTFLTQHGLALRLQMLLEKANAEQRKDLMAIAERLLSPEQMGTLFKCLIFKL